MVEIKKRPGADYVVRYQDIETGEIEEMSVFGAASFDAALADAKDSLHSSAAGSWADDWYEIVAIERVGVTEMEPV